MDAALTVTATYSERDIGGYGRAYWCGFVRLTADCIDATAELDRDGEVASIDGEYPAALREALVEIAELASGLANPWAGGCRPVTRWTIADGEVELVDDATAEAA